MLKLLKQSASDWVDDRCPSMAAALSYYTAFSLPPLLVLILVILGATMDPQDIQSAIENQVRDLVGETGADQVHTILLQANRPDGGLLPTIFGSVALAFGATAVFGELQAALNKTWRVMPDPSKGGVKNFLVKRLFSFTFVIGIAFLLLVSLVLSALISAFGAMLSEMVNGGLSTALLFVIDLSISLLLFTLIFAVTFKYLPDATVQWGDVFHGAVLTALLFLAGKFGIGFYLGRSNPGQAYGAAGSLAVLLVWLYYSSMILLFGAEFTRNWAVRRGSGITPEDGAIHTRPPVGD
jgi:membrane protein